MAESQNRVAWLSSKKSYVTHLPLINSAKLNSNFQHHLTLTFRNVARCLTRVFISFELEKPIMLESEFV
jgi:hypothetical protein